MSKGSSNDDPVLGDGVPTPEVKAELEKDVSPDATVPAELQTDDDDKSNKEK